MSDLTKIATKLLVGVKELCDWGIGEGHIDSAQMRLSIEGRRIAATKLIEGGLSQRAAARVLDVSESTLRDTLNPEKKKVRNKRARGAQQARISEIPTEEEAEDSYQQTLFEQACLLLSEMADETRQRFFAKLKEGYGYAS